MVNIEWDREDSEFIWVSAVVLLLLPILIYFIISMEDVTGTFFKSLMKTPFYGDYLS